MENEIKKPETATEAPAPKAEAKPKKKRHRPTIDEKIAKLEGKKSDIDEELQKLIEARDAGRKEAIWKILEFNGLVTETAVQSVLKYIDEHAPELLHKQETPTKPTKDKAKS